MKFAVRQFVILCLLSFSVETQAFDRSHTLKGTTLHYPPYQYEIEGKPTGLAIEILEEAIRRTDIKDVEVSFFPWKRAVNSIENGNQEVLFNAGKNEARKEWGNYSKHILILQKYYLFARKGSQISTDLNFGNLDKYSIAIRAGYLYGSGPFKKAITNETKFKSVSETNSTKQSVRLLLSERVDMFVGDFLPVMHYIKNNNLMDQIELVQRTGTHENLSVLTWPTYFLFSKQNVPIDYFNQFDEALANIIEDGTYQSIYESYNLKYRLTDN